MKCRWCGKNTNYDFCDVMCKQGFREGIFSLRLLKQRKNDSIKWTKRILPYNKEEK